MEKTLNRSSKLLLESFLSNASRADEKIVSQINKAVEKKMESFDMAKKQKNAKALEDLGRLVINA